MRFLRSHIVGGILTVMGILRRITAVTELLVQPISCQSHGEDEEFQCPRDGGLPSCRFRLRRTVRSVFMSCEITLKGMEKKRRKRSDKGNSDISSYFRWLVPARCCYFFCREKGVVKPVFKLSLGLWPRAG